MFGLCWTDEAQANYRRLKVAAEASLAAWKDDRNPFEARRYSLYPNNLAETKV
jgi:hypothetical protein